MIAGSVNEPSEQNDQPITLYDVIPANTRLARSYNDRMRDIGQMSGLAQQQRRHQIDIKEHTQTSYAHETYSKSINEHIKKEIR